MLAGDILGCVGEGPTSKVYTFNQDVLNYKIDPDNNWYPPNQQLLINALTIEQERLAQRLYSDYKDSGLSLDDIRDCIQQNPNLTEYQLRILLKRYKEVIKTHPHLVNAHGEQAVFAAFIALSAYDPAQGGNYSTLKPSVERKIEKGIEEAIVELGAMETGKVDWPFAPADHPLYEGTDPHNQKWDVKAPRSKNPKGKYIFNATKLVNGMKDDFRNNENVIIDTRQITQAEIQELYQELQARGQEKRVVWWPTGPWPTP